MAIVLDENTLSELHNPTFCFFRRDFEFVEPAIFSKVNVVNSFPSRERPVFIVDSLESVAKPNCKYVTTFADFYNWYCNVQVNFHPDEQQCIKLYRQILSKDQHSVKLAVDVLTFLPSEYFPLKNLLSGLKYRRLNMWLKRMKYDSIESLLQDKFGDPIYGVVDHLAFITLLTQNYSNIRDNNYNLNGVHAIIEDQILKMINKREIKFNIEFELPVVGKFNVGNYQKHNSILSHDDTFKLSY